MLAPQIVEFIRRMPKVELHVHLEGSIAPATLLEMARRNGIELPADDLAGVERLFDYEDFIDFLRVYMLCARALCTREDFEQLTYEVLCTAAGEQIRYIELFISSMQYHLRGLDLADLLKGIAAGMRRAKADTGIEAGLMFDYGRQFGGEQATQLAQLAVENRDLGVVAFSIGGDEFNHPPELFIDAFRIAREAGLGLTAHAGEAAGPQSVRAAVELLGATRIGHGIRSLEDPLLVAELKKRGTVLDVCPTSNLRTGVVTELAQHPLRRLHDAGLRITINSDDPTLFGTTLTDEFMLAAQHFGFSIDEICGIVQTAVDASFLQPDRKAQLLARIVDEQQTLRAQIGV